MYDELIGQLRNFAVELRKAEDALLVRDAAEAIEELSKERKKGEWLQLGKCSECGGSAPFWSMASTYYESDFCPHCGADMRGET